MEENIYTVRNIRLALLKEYEEYAERKPDVSFNEWLLAAYGEDTTR